MVRPKVDFIHNKIKESVLLTIKLILNDVVEYFKQEEDKMVVCRSSIQEPRCAEGLINDMVSSLC